MRTAGARVENAYGLERARAGVTTGGRRGSGGMLPRKILKFDVAKRPFSVLLMLRASHFSSSDIP